jgi:Na+/melibiose symporter-like transporter
MIPDSIEWGELKTGERHEGVYYSLVTLLRKVARSPAIQDAQRPRQLSPITA